ncbi:hypothetical protein KBI52_15105 [Microvirga sp. HBU67558]|uniref:hypothetical protein n=1 Tax=Microvirga TaxID=186650 RepID=UPI001B385147|nr:MULTISPECIES: hypothetical protein [unclassified Microvirga]MBQ0821528.1 hypothetical protein [Microvirga sp. HBU67558]
MASSRRFLCRLDEDISTACADGDAAAALHENNKSVAIGRVAVLDCRKVVPFDVFSELSVVMPDPAIKASGPIVRVMGFEKVRERMRDGR